MLGPRLKSLPTSCSETWRLESSCSLTCAGVVSSSLQLALLSQGQAGINQLKKRVGAYGLQKPRKISEDLLRDSVADVVGTTLCFKTAY